MDWVWLSNVPLDPGEGAEGDMLLEVALALSYKDLGDYEWIEEGKPNREWLVPARLINQHATIRVVEEAWQTKARKLREKWREREKRRRQQSSRAKTPS